MSTQELCVWMNDELVGTWRVARTGRHSFIYNDAWLGMTRSRPLSLSLPMTANNLLEGPMVSNYFDNLLPDNNLIRQRIKDRFNTKSTDPFFLLAEVGRDCAGAVQLLPHGITPELTRPIRYEALSTPRLATIMSSLDSRSPTWALDEEEVFRLSVSGAQEKTALLKVKGQWCRPLGTTPTTHIIKPAIGITPGLQLDLNLSVENEWLCNQIIHELGLPAARCEMENWEEHRVLVVERFGRRWLGDDWLVRLPQEDFCQAKGVPSHQKYEQNGGPSIEACLEVLSKGESFHEDGRNFLCAHLLFWFLAAIDGHAKNFSLFMLPGGRYKMTPIYDVLSAWPIVGTGPHELQYKKVKMAMAVRGKSAHYHLCDIQPRHWQALANRSMVDGAWQAMLDMTHRLDAALKAVEQKLPSDFPSPLANRVFQGARRHLDYFLKSITAH